MEGGEEADVVEAAEEVEEEEEAARGSITRSWTMGGGSMGLLSAERDIPGAGDKSKRIAYDSLYYTHLYRRHRTYEPVLALGGR